MAPKTSHEISEIKEARRKQILDNACILFAGKGYHETSISMIAREAGISKGLIYNYFESKETLLKALIKRGLEEAYRDFDLDHDGILTHQEFEVFINSYLNSLKQNREFWNLFFAVLIQPSVLEIVKEDMISLEFPFIKILQDYFTKNGYEDPETEVELLGAILIGIAVNMISPEFVHTDKLRKKILKMYHPKTNT